MIALESLLRARDIPFDYRDNRIICFPHVINICATHTIETFTDARLADDQAELNVSPSQGDGGESYDAVGRNPVVLCRSLVRAIRASGKRRDYLDEVICTGNAKEWYKPRLPQVQLLSDCKTRWDSMFQMIRRFRDLRPVSDPKLLFVYVFIVQAGH
jgi:hypothetical protein